MPSLIITVFKRQLFNEVLLTKNFLDSSKEFVVNLGGELK